MRAAMRYNWELAVAFDSLSWTAVIDRHHQPTGTPILLEIPNMKSRLLAVMTAVALATTLAACGNDAKEAAAKAEASAKEAAAKATEAAKDAAAKADAAAKEAAAKATEVAKDAGAAMKDAGNAMKDAGAAAKDAAGKAVDAAKDAAPKK